jgi:hypothetical protein
MDPSLGLLTLDPERARSFEILPLNASEYSMPSPIVALARDPFHIAFDGNRGATSAYIDRYNLAPAGSPDRWRRQFPACFSPSHIWRPGLSFRGLDPPYLESNPMIAFCTHGNGGRPAD